jgi:sugar/nucleoside kinase (ribokinase family)
MATKAFSVGNTCIDVVMRHADKLPNWGTEQVFDAVEERLGGQGANFAIASARLGVPTWLLSSVGNDERGSRMRSELDSIDNLNCSLVKTERASTGFSIAVVHPGGNRFFLTSLGHQSRFSLKGPDERAISMLAKGDVVHVSGYFLMPRVAGGLVRFLRKVRTKGAVVSFDPGWNPAEPTKSEYFWKIMNLVDWTFLSEDELMALSSKRSIPSAAKMLGRSLTGRMVVKGGSRGCVVFDDGRIVAEESGFNVPVVDSVGAGDAFDAGFLAGLGRGLPLGSCAKLGNATAALLVSRTGGPRQRFPSMSEVERFRGEDVVFRGDV